MLKRIHIHKTFVNFEWSPPPVCALVGENGAGKTAFIEILWAVRQLVLEGKRIDETALLEALAGRAHVGGRTYTRSHTGRPHVGARAYT